MGLFDRFKKFKNYITGGGVEVSIGIKDECYLRKPFEVAVSIKVGEQQTEADRIYIHIKYTEKVKASGHVHDSDGSSSRETFYDSEILFEEKLILDEDKILLANERYDYTASIELPVEVSPSFNGVNAELIWTMQVFVDKPGNDPESEELKFDPLYQIV